MSIKRLRCSATDSGIS